MFLGWVKVVDWVNRDCAQSGMPYALWNPIVVFPFLVGFFLFALTVPYVGWLLLTITLVAPLATYIVLRNKQVEVHQRVLTPSHLRHYFASVLNRFGMKIDTEEKLDHQKGAPVEINALGGATDRDNNVNLLTARQSPGFLLVKQLIADTVDKRGGSRDARLHPTSRGREIPD